MKNLLYKEFTLSVHPLVYVFLALMSLVAISPGMPAFIPLIYFGASYTFLFIGMNKTTTTNDLFYTCTLPIQRKDVVKARVCSTSVIQLVYLVLSFACFCISKFGFMSNMPSTKLDELTNEIISVGIDQGIYLAGAFLIGFGVFDLIYLPWFYKNGKSIILNMFVGILGIVSAGSILTIVPHYIDGFEDLLTIGHSNASYILQFGFLGFSILLWLGSKLLVIKLSTKNLVKLDF